MSGAERCQAAQIWSRESRTAGDCPGAPAALEREKKISARRTSESSAAPIAIGIHGIERSSSLRGPNAAGPSEAGSWSGGRGAVSGIARLYDKEKGGRRSGRLTLEPGF